MLKRIATVFAYLLVAATAPLSATEPITDESLRMDVLQAVFPKTTISLAVGRSIDDSWGPTGHSKEFLFPDALATEKVYQVAGPASGQAEECAASDVTHDSPFSQIRKFAFRYFAGRGPLIPARSWPSHNMPFGGRIHRVVPLNSPRFTRNVRSRKMARVSRFGSGYNPSHVNPDHQAGEFGWRPISRIADRVRLGRGRSQGDESCHILVEPRQI